ncbi:TPA: hypothetical protein ACF86T_002729 [Staphylococcus aureus]|mgnify:FL=1|uniref:Uncharacterized protein n=2 Tax=Staphylococcus TaxID=1279 RepID=D2JC12_STAEP|nr:MULTISPECIES: hypothetical protein [Staphylococcus]MBN4936149.1 hypothetical protein [Staphylococcus sp. EG-SA-6]OFM91317.1 hypothetical protein HMPREF2639_07810 [Staphylococcus sp. HMSC078D05]HDX8202974.1 hypothetical protein [Staphylococcus aureus W39830]HDX8211393.1 hypothetical protein [Staphylococcus aureus W31863]ADA61829.1 hypothetical protein SAP047A_010 [Staphylococcus aureus]
MEFEKIDISLSISREDNGTSLVFNTPLELTINLSDEDVKDIQKLYNEIFDYVVQYKKLPQFNLNDSKNDLFHEVSMDIIKSLNNEIDNSKKDFERIIELL